MKARKSAEDKTQWPLDGTDNLQETRLLNKHKNVGTTNHATNTNRMVDGAENIGKYN